MEWFLDIEKKQDFVHQVVKFRARTTNNGSNNFITCFGERDAEVRRLNKMVQERAKVVGYHRAVNVLRGAQQVHWHQGER